MQFRLVEKLGGIACHTVRYDAAVSVLLLQVGTLTLLAAGSPASLPCKAKMPVDCQKAGLRDLLNDDRPFAFPSCQYRAVIQRQ